MIRIMLKKYSKLTVYLYEIQVRTEHDTVASFVIKQAVESNANHYFAACFFVFTH